jgi:hypothetical protein
MVGDDPSIVHVATQLSSYSTNACGRAIDWRIGAKASDGATLTLTCFPFGAGPTLGFFILAPILSTPAFGIDRLAMLFCTVAFAGAPDFVATLAFGVASAFTGAALDEEAFDEATFDGAAFDEATQVLFGVAETFGVVAFQPDTFMRFLASPVPASSLLFLVASLPAS